jgi:nitroreductase
MNMSADVEKDTNGRDVIFERASVRAFTDAPVSDEQARLLLRAAMAAPSAGNQQPWEFYVVRDPQMLAKLAGCSPYAKPTAKAPCCIVPCLRTQGLRFPGCASQDMGACVENILLEATRLGLGAVWQAIYPEPERMQAAREVLGLGDGLEAFCLIAIGTPASEVHAKGADRYDESRVSWVDGERA